MNARQRKKSRKDAPEREMISVKMKENVDAFLMAECGLDDPDFDPRGKTGEMDKKYLGSYNVMVEFTENLKDYPYSKTHNLSMFGSWVEEVAPKEKTPREYVGL